MVAILPKDHGEMVPASFFAHGARVREAYMTYLTRSQTAETERNEKMQVYDAFLWFMSDGRELSRPPQDREEVVSRFEAWCMANVQGDFPLKRIVQHLDCFFQWISEERVVSPHS